MARSKAYRVRYERDESGWWQASIPVVKGCHTQGRTIDEARRRIREALQLFIDDADQVRLTDDVQIPKRVAAAVKRYRTARQRADREQLYASATARRAVKALAGGRLHLSRRDAADLLGISAQRVQQLLETDWPIGGFVTPEAAGRGTWWFFATRFVADLSKEAAVARALRSIREDLAQVTNHAHRCTRAVEEVEENPPWLWNACSGRRLHLVLVLAVPSELAGTAIFEEDAPLLWQFALEFQREPNGANWSSVSAIGAPSVTS